MIFTKSLMKIDYTNAPKALKTMASHIRYIQEQLEYTLMNLDSSNVREIDAGVTDITSSGGASITGTKISYSGNNGEKFEAGKGNDGTFVFTLLAKGGKQVMYLANEGNLVITRDADITIDGGEW